MKRVVITISVWDNESDKGYSSSKMTPYDTGDVNQTNFSRHDGINQVTYLAQEAFTEIVEKINEEAEVGRP